MTDTDDETGMFFQNSIAMAVSREELIAYGHIEPTDEERVIEHARRVEWHGEALEAWKVYDDARAALAQIEEPITRTVLALHHADSIEGPTCKGCDFGGYESEPPEWPCRTVELVAARWKIRLPEPWHLSHRPDPEPPTLDDVWPPGRKPFRVADLFPSSFVTLAPITFDVAD